MKVFNLRYAATIISLLALLVGCSTTASNNYYLLSATIDKNPSGEKPSLGVGPIEIPEYLNRNGLVYNRAGNQLHIASHERWAEPIANGIERVFSLNLSSLLNTENVQSFPWPRSEAPDYAIQITLMSLDANDTQASLIAEWVLQKPRQSEFLLRRITRLYTQMPPGAVTPEQVAPAYSQLLLQLSERVAAEIEKDLAAKH